MSSKKKHPDYVLKEMEKRLKEIGVPPSELERRMKEAEHYADYAKNQVLTDYSPKEFRKYARRVIRKALEQYGVKEEENAM